jgi:hypothetical protein
MGRRIERLLPVFIENESNRFRAEVEYNANRNLLVYTVFNSALDRYQVLSDVLVQGINAEFGTHTTLTIYIIDEVTDSKQTFEIPLYILNAPTYQRFEARGIIAKSIRTIRSQTTLISSLKGDNGHGGDNNNRDSDGSTSSPNDDSNSSSYSGKGGSDDDDRFSKDGGKGGGKGFYKDDADSD